MNYLVAGASCWDAGPSGLGDIFLFVPIPVFLGVKLPSNLKKKKMCKQALLILRKTCARSPPRPSTWSAEVPAGPGRELGGRWLRFRAFGLQPRAGTSGGVSPPASQELSPEADKREAARPLLGYHLQIEALPSGL